MGMVRPPVPEADGCDDTRRGGTNSGGSSDGPEPAHTCWRVREVLASGEWEVAG